MEIPKTEIAEQVKWMVYVSCTTFNHAPYIVDAMNGFTMQETNFPFVCAIVDDASTDGEQEVIKNYLDEHFDLKDNSIVRHEETDDYVLTFARHKTNLNCHFAVLYLKYNHYSIKKFKAPYTSEWNNHAKYVAICEGDDYWIDPRKLQKQVDFMEAHPQHSLCFCAHKELYPSGNMIDVLRYEKKQEECPMHDIILVGGGFMATNTMFYRKSMYVPYSTWAIGCPIGDSPTMLSLAHCGKVGYLADVMCVYRRMAVGSWSVRMASSRKFRKSHKRAIIKMWHQFDEWSGGRYHEDVMKRVRDLKKIHIIIKLKLLVKKFLF